jgi:hypothetical protein
LVTLAEATAVVGVAWVAALWQLIGSRPVTKTETLVMICDIPMPLL